MKYLVIILFFPILVFAQQPNTEIFLFDMSIENGQYSFSNGKNISKNEGYDNQPSFINDNEILFASTRKGQTDIVSYRTNYKTKTWINYTEGGEYTPLKIPDSHAVSAVRLDKDGKQRLYSYNLSNGESTELIKDLVVAYYTWFNSYILVSAVIEDDDLNLYVSNLEEGWNRKYDTKVGRSFHKIPNTNEVSFISKKDNNNWQIKSLNITTAEIKTLANTIEGIEDMCWMSNGDIVMGKGTKLYKLTLKKDNDWKEIADLSDYGITKITRIIGNSISNKFLIAAEIDGDPKVSNSNSNSGLSTNSSSTSKSEIEAIINRNLEAYRAKDLDAFMKDYAEDVKIYNYPNELRTDGKKAMREGYKSWFERAQGLDVEIKSRIIIGNKVIDEEEVTANGQSFKAVAIYEINNDKITRVTFMR